jgi:hypothetical protein
MLPEEADRLPPVLRVLLEAELRAGNRVAEVGHAFPAAPIGAWFLLERPLLTRARASGGGIDYYYRNHPRYSGEITDATRHFFLLEPPGEPAPTPASHSRDNVAHEPPAQRAPVSSGLVARFKASRNLDYEKWREGTGYDLEAIAQATPQERREMERSILAAGIQGWRDVEALVTLGSAKSRAALRKALRAGSAEVKMAILRRAPDLVSASARTRCLCDALRTADFFEGLSEALQEAQIHHPPAVIAELFRGLEDRPGGIAVHFAALLYFLHGKTSDPFDWNHRPFFLTFHTEDRAERAAAVKELRRRLAEP